MVYCMYSLHRATFSAKWQDSFKKRFYSPKKSKSAEKQSILWMIWALKSSLMGYDSRYFSAYIWLCRILELHLKWVILVIVGLWACDSKAERKRVGGLCRRPEQRTQLVTQTWASAAGCIEGKKSSLLGSDGGVWGQHDKWGWKAAQGYKSISPLSCSFKGRFSHTHLLVLSYFKDDGGTPRANRVISLHLTSRQHLASCYCRETYLFSKKQTK